jgi:hypothetical protein
LGVRIVLIPDAKGLQVALEALPLVA